MDGCIDNCFEWYSGEKTATVTFSQLKFVNKIKKFAKDRPEEIEILAENEDGSIMAHVPTTWFNFKPPKPGRVYTEEEKAIAAERLREARARKKNVKTD